MLLMLGALDALSFQHLVKWLDQTVRCDTLTPWEPR
jgi:hypothetical protein